MQGAFISTDETERLMEWYKAHAAAAVQPPGTSIDEQVAALEKAEKEEEGGGSQEPGAGERDPLFRQAAEVCIQNQLGSTSLLQRRMSIGYGRAARIIDQLELAGIVPPQCMTAFTASDFGRTFPANGQGSDHGWGSHHLILGGAVNGGRGLGTGKTYGRFPNQTINGPDDTNTGRWIPSTAIDQYCATLASWFGVTNSDLNIVFPNLNRFANPDLGFMM